MRYRRPDCVDVHVDKNFSHSDCRRSLAGLLSGPVRIPRPQVPAFLNLDWPRLAGQGGVEADFALDDFELEPAAPEFKLHLAGGLAVLQAKLECFYGGASAASLPPATPWLPDPQSTHALRHAKFCSRTGGDGALAAGRVHRAGRTGSFSSAKGKIRC